MFFVTKPTVVARKAERARGAPGTGTVGQPARAPPLAARDRHGLAGFSSVPFEPDEAALIWNLKTERKDAPEPDPRQIGGLRTAGRGGMRSPLPSEALHICRRAQLFLICFKRH